VQNPTLLIDVRNADKNIDKLLKQLHEALFELDIAYYVVKDNDDLDLFIEKSDIWLLLSDKYDNSEDILGNGLVPVVSQNVAAKLNIDKYNPIKEEGAGYIYKKKNVWNVLAALFSAVENFQFPFDWKNLVVSVKQLDPKAHK